MKNQFEKVRLKKIHAKNTSVEKDDSLEEILRLSMQQAEQEQQMQQEQQVQQRCISSKIRDSHRDVFWKKIYALESALYFKLWFYPNVSVSLLTWEFLLFFLKDSFKKLK